MATNTSFVSDVTSAMESVDEKISIPDEHVRSLGERLTVVESKVEALPAIMAEAINKVFMSIRWTDFPLSVEKDHTTGYEVVVQDQYGNKISSAGSVNGGDVIDRIAESFEATLKKEFDFSELESMREHISKLETDLEYRRKVADRLMEEPRGNNKP